MGRTMPPMALPQEAMPIARGRLVVKVVLMVERLGTYKRPLPEKLLVVLMRERGCKRWIGCIRTYPNTKPL